jgi:sulfite exporter TauE/SafE
VTHLLPFLGGLAGSLHCVGMCGAFPLALGGDPAARWRRQLLYNLGRVNTLIFIGAVSGAAGAALVASGPVALAERVLAVVAGSLMILVGLEMLLPFSFLTRFGAALARVTVGRVLASVVRSRSAAAPLALGVFNAFLPCQLIYAFAAQAAGTASVTAGMATMLAFGIGTVPAMLAVGAAPALVRPALRARLARAVAVLVVLFGAFTVLRGLQLVPHAGHAPHVHVEPRRAPALGVVRPEVAGGVARSIPGGASGPPSGSTSRTR